MADPTTKFSAQVLAAMCGNFQIESGVNPTRWEIGHRPANTHTAAGYEILGAGFSFGQWTNVGDSHGRLYQVGEAIGFDDGYPSDTNKQDSAGRAAFNFIFTEDYWQGTSGGISSLQDFMSSSSTDLYLLTKAWYDCWEGISNSTLAQRYEAAQTFFGAIQQVIEEGFPDGFDYHFIGGDRGLDGPESTHNVLMMWYLNGGITPPGPVQKGKRKIYNINRRSSVLYC